MNEFDCSNSIYELTSDMLCKPKTPLQAQSPLTLAFVGDAVFSLIFRTMVVNQGNSANGKLHTKTTKYVSAPAQAKLADWWQDNGVLTEEEHDIYRRGMNAKPKSQAKNASTIDYHKATGVEALCGYLYQKGETKRLIELIKLGIENI